MLRDRLRTDTQTHHERIERKLEITKRVRNKNEYIKLLERFYGFYFPLEVKLEQFKSEFQVQGFDLNLRLKADLIKRDLINLGCPLSRLHNLPYCFDLPKIIIIEHALGCLYVLEGSTLGGQIIARYFCHILQITQENGCKLFSGYGPETTKMWQSFVSFLNIQGELFRDHTEIVSTACDTFERLEAWLTT